MARPNLYDTEIKDKLILIQGWARDGLTNEQIAHNLGVAVSSFYKYKAENIELSEALKKGKEVIDREVENALLKRALGYEYIETKTTTNEEGKEFVVTTTKEVVPDTTAQIFWLKNRKPKVWRDKQEISQNINAEVTNLTQEEKEKKLKDLKERLEDIYE